MLKLVKIAVTGGIASGKTTVCELFKKAGAYVVSADAIAHELLDPETDLGRQIIRALGSDILQNGKINRQVVAEKVFKDPKALRELEQILHPVILTRIEQTYFEACQSNYKAFVVEIPLLYEIGAEGFYDVVIAVESDEKIAKQRFGRDYERRMKRHLDPKIKSAKAHYTIKNNGTLDDLRKEVEKLQQRVIHP